MSYRQNDESLFCLFKRALLELIKEQGFFDKFALFLLFDWLITWRSK